MQDAVLFARELTQADTFNDAEKDTITRDMAELQEHYDELRNFVEEEQEGFENFSCLHLYSEKGLNCHYE